MSEFKRGYKAGYDAGYTDARKRLAQNLIDNIEDICYPIERNGKTIWVVNKRSIIDHIKYEVREVRNDSKL